LAGDRKTLKSKTMKRLFSTVILACAILIALWFGGLMGFFGQCAAPVSKLLACGSGPKPVHYGPFPGATTNSVSKVAKPVVPPKTS
jgi:hypothetical protein